MTREIGMRRLRLACGLLLFLVLCTTSVFASGLFQVGENAPPFTLSTLVGEPLSLESYKGKVVARGLFHICEPCMVQGSALQKVYESTRGKNVAGLGVNSSGNAKREVGEFLSEFPWREVYSQCM